MACQGPPDLLDGTVETEGKVPRDLEALLDQKVPLVDREILGPRDLPGPKEQWDQKDRGCQV